MPAIKALLVDDEEGFTSTLAERLALRDFEVSVALSGKEALDVTQKACPDIVLLDLSLPDMGGEEVLGEIKKIDSTIEVIIISGRCLIDQNDIKGGPFSCVSKPVKLIDLVEVMNAAYEAVQKNRGE